MSKMSKGEVIAIRRCIEQVLGMSRAYDFWHNVVLKTPEDEFIDAEES